MPSRVTYATDNDSAHWLGVVVTDYERKSLHCMCKRWPCGQQESTYYPDIDIYFTSHCGAESRFPQNAVYVIGEVALNVHNDKWVSSSVFVVNHNHTGDKMNYEWIAVSVAETEMNKYYEGGSNRIRGIRQERFAKTKIVKFPRGARLMWMAYLKITEEDVVAAGTVVDGTLHWVSSDYQRVTPELFRDTLAKKFGV